MGDLTITIPHELLWFLAGMATMLALLLWINWIAEGGEDEQNRKPPSE